VHGTSRPEGPRSSAAGPIVEVPYRGAGCGEVSPFPLGEGSGEVVWVWGSAPSPENFLTLNLQMVTFGAYWCFFCLFYTQKLVLLGFQICRCNLLLYFKLMILTDGLTSHHNPVSLTDSSL